MPTYKEQLIAEQEDQVKLIDGIASLHWSFRVILQVMILGLTLGLLYYFGTALG